MKSRPGPTHLAQRRRATLGNLGLQRANELAELHAVVQLLHEKLGSHLLAWRQRPDKQKHGEKARNGCSLVALGCSLHQWFSLVDYQGATS